ncbi:MAG: Zn-dependent M28 family amino/carboxypeptidase [Saprospiraceae bacterium]|jgi:Zn-dependent M28 family amino/carboxypeptidase
MFQYIQKTFLILLIAVFAIGCKSDSTKITTVDIPEKTTRRKVPKFDNEKAYQNIEKQVNFGHRYPGTQAHKDLIKYLTAELTQYTDQVITQDFKVDFLDKKGVDATNIIGIVNPDRKKRILLCAHFDTRKIAEKDEDPAMQNQPILGADDGGSGVGILLEIARLVKENGIDIGVDFILFDAEDNGNDGEGWCLGSEYWAKKPHIANYKANFGILLDLVGAKNAEFGKEQFSLLSAKTYVDKIWTLAERMSFANYFIDFESGPVMDDHVNVINYRKIPMIDIINMSNQNDREGFDHYHHTQKDNMDIIDTNTIRAVGKVVTATLYNFNNGTL